MELPWGMRGPREGEVAAFLAAHLATRGLTCLLVVDDLWDRSVGGCVTEGSTLVCRKEIWKAGRKGG